METEPDVHSTRRNSRMKMMLAQHGYSADEDHSASDGLAATFLSPKLTLDYDESVDLHKYIAAEGIERGTLLFKGPPRLLYPNFHQYSLDSSEAMPNGRFYPDKTFCISCLDLVASESIVWCRDCNLPLCSKCGGPNEHMYTDRLCHYTKTIKDLISSGPGPGRIGRFTELAEIYLDVTITRFLMMQTNSEVFEKEIQLVLADTEVQRILFGVEERLGHVLNARRLPLSFFATRQKELPICRAYAILVASGNNFKSDSEIKVGVFHPILTNLTPSCDTNVVITVNQMERNLELRSSKKIPPGEPISLDYMDYPLLTADQRKRLIKSPWSSKCICTTCFAHKDFVQYQTSAETFDYNKYYENPIYSEVRTKVEPKSALPVKIDNYGGSGDAQPQVPVRVEYVDASGDGRGMSYVTPAGTSAQVSIKHLEEEEPTGVDKRRLTRPRGLVAQQLLDAIEDRIAEDEEAQRLAAEAAIEEANHVALPEQEVEEIHPVEEIQPVEEEDKKETPPSEAEQEPVEPEEPPPPRRNLLLEAMNSEENAERLKIRMVQLEQFRLRKEARQQQQLLEAPDVSDVSGEDVVTASPEPEVINLVTKMSPSKAIPRSPGVTSTVSAPELKLSTTEVKPYTRELRAPKPGPTPSAPDFTKWGPFFTTPAPNLENFAVNLTTSEPVQPESNLSTLLASTEADGTDLTPADDQRMPESLDTCVPTAVPACDQLKLDSPSDLTVPTQVRAPPGFPETYLATSSPPWCPPEMIPTDVATTVAQVRAPPGFRETYLTSPISAWHPAELDIAGTKPQNPDIDWNNNDSSSSTYHHVSGSDESDSDSTDTPTTVYSCFSSRSSFSDTDTELDSPRDQYK